MRELYKDFTFARYSGMKAGAETEAVANDAAVMMGDAVRVPDARRHCVRRVRAPARVRDV